jgi:hypothetical protein
MQAQFDTLGRRHGARRVQGRELPPAREFLRALFEGGGELLGGTVHD